MKHSKLYVWAGICILSVVALLLYGEMRSIEIYPIGTAMLDHAPDPHTRSAFIAERDRRKRTEQKWRTEVGVLLTIDLIALVGLVAILRVRSTK